MKEIRQTSTQYNTQIYKNKLKNLNQLKKNKTQTFLKWNQSTHKWQQLNSIIIAKPYTGQTITTVSYNVLYDRIQQQNMQHVLNSKQRYTYIIQKLGQITAQVIGLQEVTTLFFQMLLESRWVEKEYYVSNLKGYQGGWGNLILTKIQPISIQIIKVNRLPRNVCTLFIPVLHPHKKQVQIVTFSSIHLIAYDKNHEIRVQQIKNLIQQLQPYNKIVSQYILQGDFNFHAQFQTQNMLKHGVKDCWLQKYDNNLKQYPGYTFDSNNNSLINQLYWGFQRRRMRLDRIFGLGNVLKIKNMKIIMNQPTNNDNIKKQVNNYWYLKGGVLYITDRLGWNLHKNKQQFLFPSDHFGLFATFQINKQDRQQNKLII